MVTRGETLKTMIHIRIDEGLDNKNRKFACGIGPELPDGDTYYFADESISSFATCKTCNPNRTIGTPISKLSGTIGDPGYNEFLKISESWGYD